MVASSPCRRGLCSPGQRYVNSGWHARVVLLLTGETPICTEHTILSSLLRSRLFQSSKGNGVTNDPSLVISNIEALYPVRSYALIEHTTWLRRCNFSYTWSQHRAGHDLIDSSLNIIAPTPIS